MYVRAGWATENLKDRRQ